MRWFAAYAADVGGRLLEPDGHGQLEQESANLELALGLAIERDPSCALGIVAEMLRHWLLTEPSRRRGCAAAAALAAAGDEVNPATVPWCIAERDWSAC